jgi:hypothetical protein
VSQLAINDVPSFLAGLFALALFVLSLYAWFRRKQSSLIIVSFAFFLYFVKEMMELIPVQSDIINLTQNLLDFTILVTFFIAIITGPRIRRSKKV